MNLKKYYPNTSIKNIELDNDIIIIHTSSSERETRNIHDLPIFGKKVIIKVSEDKKYSWMDTNGNTKRLNNFISLCCRAVEDGHTIEHILTLSGIRLCPSDYDTIKALTAKRSVSTHININDFSSGRGRKTGTNYNFIVDTIRNLLTTGIPDNDSSDTTSDYFLNNEFANIYNRARSTTTHKPTIREIQKYFKENTDFDAPSLSTIHKILHTELSKDGQPSGNFFHYQKADVDFRQNLIFDDKYHNHYHTLEDEYKTLEFQPKKIDIQGTSISQILTEIKSNEKFVFTASATDFYTTYQQWSSYFEIVLRLCPCIIIRDQILYFSFATYNTTQARFGAFREFSFPLKINATLFPDNELVRFLYTGKRDFGMRHYTERGALFNLDIPKEGTIEIGIGECLRISTQKDNYLIPFLEFTEHII